MQGNTSKETFSVIPCVKLFQFCEWNQDRFLKIQIQPTPKYNPPTNLGDHPPVCKPHFMYTPFIVDLTSTFWLKGLFYLCNIEIINNFLKFWYLSTNTNYCPGTNLPI